MSKHTPGPWEWCGDTLEAGVRTVLEVQDLPERTYPELQSGQLVMENEAHDKPLIAAAPEMAEALNALIQAHTKQEECDDCEADDLSVSYGYCRRHAGLYQNAVIKAKAMLAKARGEAGQGGEQTWPTMSTTTKISAPKTSNPILVITLAAEVRCTARPTPAPVTVPVAPRLNRTRPN